MPKFDLAGHRKIWFLISALIIIPGIICMFVRGFNFGIDFTGGTIIDLKFAQPVTIAEVRTSLAKYGLDGSTIQLSGAQSDVTSSEDVMIRTTDLEEEQRKEVMATLKQDVGDYTVLREEKVGATSAPASSTASMSVFGSSPAFASRPATIMCRPVPGG